MKKQKKQSLLTALIIILVIILVMMIGSIAYEEVINMNKKPLQSTNSKLENEDRQEEIKQESTPIEDEKENEEIIQEPVQEEKQDEEYLGEEEKNTQENNVENKDEKAINLVKKEWGNDDSVTFSIEKKNGSKYRVAVRDGSTTVLQWYEVDTETWEVSEY